MPHAFGAFQSVDGGDTILGSMLLTLQSCQLIVPIFLAVRCQFLIASYLPPIFKHRTQQTQRQSRS